MIETTENLGIMAWQALNKQSILSTSPGRHQAFEVSRDQKVAQQFVDVKLS
jgi:hypothetical protein